MINKVRINSRQDFMENYLVVYNALKYVNDVDGEHVPENIVRCYEYRNPLPKASILRDLMETEKYYGDNGYFELAFEGDSLVGFGGVRIDRGISHLAKRTYIVKRFRSKYQNQTLFLPEQLSFRRNDCLFAVQTFNQGQFNIVKTIRRILNKKPVFLGKSIEETFPVYLSNNLIILDRMYRIYDTDQYVVVFNYNNLGVDVIDDKLKEFS